MNDTAATKALYSASVARIQSLMPRSFEAMEMDKGNEAASSTLSIAGAYDNPDDAIWLDTAKITFRFSGADANPGYATWGSLEVYDGFKASGQSSLTSLLDCAANAGDEKAKATFFDLGSTDLNVRSEYGLTPLHRAADWGNTEAIKALLDIGADVNPATNSTRLRFIRRWVRATWKRSISCSTRAPKPTSMCLNQAG